MFRRPYFIVYLITHRCSDMPEWSSAKVDHVRPNIPLSWIHTWTQASLFLLLFIALSHAYFRFLRAWESNRSKPIDIKTLPQERYRSMSWKKFNFKSLSRSWHRILLVIWKHSAWAFYRLHMAFESEWKRYSSSQSDKKRPSMTSASKCMNLPQWRSQGLSGWASRKWGRKWRKFEEKWEKLQKNGKRLRKCSYLAHPAFYVVYFSMWPSAFCSACFDHSIQKQP